MVDLLLRLFDVFQIPLVRLGVDYRQFRAILEAKLTLDSRRQTPWAQRADKKSGWGSMAVTMLFYGFIGLFAASILFGARSALTGMTIVNAFIMTMIAMAVIADYSTVLLDTRDNAILQPRPVGGRTILVARIAHILIYLSLLALSLSLATIVTGTIVLHPLFPVVYLVTLCCSVGLVVCLASVFYLVAIRLMDAERFRNVLMYAQVGMSVLIFGGYQFLPQLLDFRVLRDLTIDDRWWIYVLPPAWMAAPIDLLTGHAGVPQIVLTCLAFVVPVAAMWIMVRELAPRFNRALAMLDATPADGKNSARETAGPSLLCRVFRLASRRPAERAAFELIWQLTARDRQFKLRTYPSMAMMFVMSFAFLLFSDPRGMRYALENLPQTQKYLFPLYFACAMVPMIVLQLRYSDKHEAAWIYGALPLARPGDVLMGGLKVVLVRFVVPTSVLVAGVVLAIWGVSKLPDIVLAFCAIVLAAILQSLLFGRRLPFSEGYGVMEGSGRSAKGFLLLVVPGILGGAHYVLLLVPGGVVMAIPAVVLIVILVARGYSNTDWATLGAAT